MGFYQELTATRTTDPDPASLLAALRALDPSANYAHEPKSPLYILKKHTAWTNSHRTAALNAIEAAPAASPQLTAQAALDLMDLYDKAIVLTILDQFNAVRAKLDPPLPAITIPQMLQAIRAKAGTL